MKHAIQTTALMLLLIASAPVAASELIREFSGTISTTTATFSVESPWIMDWRLDADYEQIVALDVSLVDAKTGRHVVHFGSAGRARSSPR